MPAKRDDLSSSGAIGCSWHEVVLILLSGSIGLRDTWQVPQKLLETRGFSLNLLVSWWFIIVESKKHLKHIQENETRQRAMRGFYYEHTSFLMFSVFREKITCLISSLIKILFFKDFKHLSPASNPFMIHESIKSTLHTHTTTKKKLKKVLASHESLCFMVCFWCFFKQRYVVVGQRLVLFPTSSSRSTNPPSDKKKVASLGDMASFFSLVVEGLYPRLPPFSSHQI